MLGLKPILERSSVERLNYCPFCKLIKSDDEFVADDGQLDATSAPVISFKTWWSSATYLTFVPDG